MSRCRKKKKFGAAAAVFMVAKPTLARSIEQKLSPVTSFPREKRNWQCDLQSKCAA
jgi:hypothetical protein